VKMQDARQTILLSLPTDLRKPIMMEISHFDQFNLTVEVNFPRNSMIITYTAAKKCEVEARS